MGGSDSACVVWEEQLRLYAADRLEGDEKELLLRHTVQCRACLNELAWLLRVQAELNRALDGPAAPAMQEALHRILTSTTDMHTKGHRSLEWQSIDPKLRRATGLRLLDDLLRLDRSPLLSAARARTIRFGPIVVSFA